jgi:cystathionine gamma-synthase
MSALHLDDALPAGGQESSAHGAAPALRTATRAVRAGIDSDPAYGAVTPPLVLSSNFSFAGFGEKRKYDYTRSGNPTRDLLAEALADLEGGAGAVVTSTGMSAITLLLHALLKPGDVLLVPHDAYGGSWRLFNALAAKGAFVLRTVNLTDAQAYRDALAENPALVWIETPSNPLLRITDLHTTIAAAHAVGAKVVVDNTFLSPLWQQPIAFGADYVAHSTTKYINGHSDVVGGAVVARRAEDHAPLVWWANALGITGAPFDSFLTLRGLRTLEARLRAHEENTHALIGVLERHPLVRKLHYPGLKSHPGHAIAARQQQGFGAMLSLELDVPAALTETAVRAFVDGLRCFTLAESLGGVESLIAHPATMTHAAMTPEARAAAGISDGLLRLSVGIEHPEDLCADIRDALSRAAQAVERASATQTDAPSDVASDVPNADRVTS